MEVQVFEDEYEKRVKLCQRKIGRCTRLILMESGRVAGCFGDQGGGYYESKDTDEEQLVVVMEPDGACLTYSFGDGKCLRQYTKFVPNEIAQPVKELIEFRNRILPTPYVDDRFFKTEDINLEFRLRAIRWPTDKNKVKSNAKGERLIRSIEGAASLVLSSNRLTFYVETLTPMSPLENDFRYKRLRQTFFTDQPPACYKHPLDLVLGNESSSLLCYVTEDVPRSCFASEPYWGEQDIVRDILLALCSNPRKCVPFFDPPQFEWSQDATYRSGSSSSKHHHEIQVSISHDRSMLTLLRNGYLKHLIGNENRVYAPEGFPRKIFTSAKEYALEPIVLHAQKLLEARTAYFENRKKPSNETQNKHNAKTSTKIMEVQMVPNLGKFTFLSDQSVHVTFVDRTLLHSDSEFTKCVVISGQDGSVQEVNVERPCLVSYYVDAAKQFRSWAISDMETRSPIFESPAVVRRVKLLRAMNAAKREQLSVQVHLQRINQMLSVKS